MKKVFLSISKVALLFAVLLPFITSCESNQRIFLFSKNVAI